MLPTVLFGSPGALNAMSASPDTQEDWDRQFELFFNGKHGTLLVRAPAKRAR